MDGEEKRSRTWSLGPLKQVGSGDERNQQEIEAVLMASRVGGPTAIMFYKAKGIFRRQRSDCLHQILLLVD